MNSESQVYQAIRHDLKKQIKFAQREYAYLVYEGEHRKCHPAKLTAMSFLLGYKVTVMPVHRQVDCLMRCLDLGTKISGLQLFLNKYKVKHDSPH